ncbi:MAG: hypothetical protein ABSG91_10175 [Syntrophobacteraceae bacterium]|jgi:hypothetical protein
MKYLSERFWQFPNEVGYATVFAKLVKTGTGKCRIPTEPKLLEVTVKGCTLLLSVDAVFTGTEDT